MKHLLTTLKLSVSGQEANREIMGVWVTVAIRLSSVSVRSTGLSRSGPFIPGHPGCSLAPPGSSWVFFQQSLCLLSAPLQRLPPPPLLLPNLHPLPPAVRVPCLAHSFQPLTCTSVSKGLWLCSLSLLAPLLLSPLSYETLSPTSTLLSFRVISVFPRGCWQFLYDLVMCQTGLLAWSGVLESLRGNLKPATISGPFCI